MLVYCENWVLLDISILENDVEIKSISMVIVLCSGVVVLVNFEIDEGCLLILELLCSDKGFIFLGVDVFNEKNEIVGIVGQVGQVYVCGVEL